MQPSIYIYSRKKVAYTRLEKSKFYLCMKLCKEKEMHETVQQ